MTPQHLKIPFSIGADGCAATLGQDTPAEIGQCVRTVLSTLKNSRTELPAFGVPDIAFTRGDVSTWTQIVAKWEPRAAGVNITSTVNPDGTASVTASIP